MNRTFLVVNAHGAGGSRDEAFARWVQKTNPEGVTFVSELGANDTALRRAGFYVLTGNGSRGREDVGIVIPKSDQGRVKQAYLERLTRDLDMPIAPDRWMAYMRFTYRAMYSLHANAVIQHRRTGGWRPWEVSDEWFEAMGKISRHVNLEQRHGRRVLIGGDMNWNKNRGPERKHPILRSPEYLAETHKLDFVTSELMWFMWDSRHYHLGEKTVIPGDDVPVGVAEEHPHPALLVTLERGPA